jgi:short-subunit dehydrogenase
MWKKIRRWLRRKKSSGGPRAYKPVILITGCATGVGHALGKKLCTCDSYRVVLTARAGASLNRVKEDFPESFTCTSHELDVTDPQSRLALLRFVRRKWGGVDILINNAGISYRAVMEHMTEEDERRQMATNYFGPVGLIREVLPWMREHGRGKIINISSVSGMLAMPTMGSYSASKHALEGASESLWYELKPLGINVTLVQPGFIHSRSFEKVYYSREAKAAAEDEHGVYGDYYRHMTPFVQRMMERSLTTPEAVARQVLKVIRTEDPPLWLPVTLDAYVFYYLRRFFPRKLFHRFLFACLPRARKWGIGYTHRRRAA